MRKVKTRAESWPLHTPFVISRGTRTKSGVVVVEIEEEGVRGVGECTPYSRYGESSLSVLKQIREVLPDIQRGITIKDLQDILPPGAARNALDSALWNITLNRRDQYKAHNCLSPVPIFRTISIDSPDAMSECARCLWEKGVRLLKVKLDANLVDERMKAIRSSVPLSTIIVDANESWDEDSIIPCCELLAQLNVAMLEQPLPAGNDEILSKFSHPLPICADESVHSCQDLPSLSGKYEMINIKLDKTGGLTEALTLAKEARARNFQVMLGCMICTSRAIVSALPLACEVDFIDLDGPTWLAEDVSCGIEFEPGQIIISQPRIAHQIGNLFHKK